jgi:hypothetical protein
MELNMDQNVAWFWQKRSAAVIEKLKKNRMDGVYLAQKEDVAQAVLADIPAGSKVAMGGSMTLFETGLVDALRGADIELIDRYAPGLDHAQMMPILKQGLESDVFVSGVNAVTEYGELVFIDCVCNRVAPILFGPSKVLLIAGANKIVPDVEDGVSRIKYYVAPTNARRLKRKTPCAETGECADCSSPDRICNATVVIHKQAAKGRIKLFLVGDALGY